MILFPFSWQFEKSYQKHVQFAKKVSIFFVNSQSAILHLIFHLGSCCWWLWKCSWKSEHFASNIHFQGFCQIIFVDFRPKLCNHQRFKNCQSLIWNCFETKLAFISRSNSKGKFKPFYVVRIIFSDVIFGTKICCDNR